jgi:adenylate cyclase
VIAQKPIVPTRTTIVFFALNFIAVSTIIYMLLRLSIAMKRKMQQEPRGSPPADQDRTGALRKAAAEHPSRADRRPAEEFRQDHRRRLCRCHRDVCRHRQLHPGGGQHVAVSGIRDAEPDLLRLRRTGGGIRPGKIKTIGDAYMVAGGLNEDLSDYSAAVADMAIAMRDLLRRDFTVNASHLEVRIGIGTGPIVAGVLGKKKFIYDLWGDTVNIASRITSEGVPGMIQCDTTTYHRLAAKFDFHEPQTIYLKGKGNMTVYRLIGRKGRAIRRSGGTGSPLLIA